MKLVIKSWLLLLALALLGCSKSPRATSEIKSYTLPAALTLDAHASRNEIGKVVISGTTNLPDGLHMWIEVEDGRLPLGAPKIVAQDDNVLVQNGKFATKPMWLSVPNTRFTKRGWPKSVHVDYRLEPFPQAKFKIHFNSYFNRAWQTQQVLQVVGGEGGKELKGPIISPTDKDAIDSPKVVDYHLTFLFPPMSSSAKAINLVRSAILVVPGKGRSAGDIQANLDLFMSDMGLRTGKGWSAKQEGPKTYQVLYDFFNGDQGEEQAIWIANVATGKVKYLNEDGKIFSWTPDY
jgi:hypothetical protein